MYKLDWAGNAIPKPMSNGKSQGGVRTNRGTSDPSWAQLHRYSETRGKKNSTETLNWVASQEYNIGKHPACDGRVGMRNGLPLRLV